jgi:hypothetical protein
MTAEDTLVPDRFWLFATGILLVTMPAITLLVAYVALTATRSVVLEQITLVEAVELYLVELAAFAAFSYLLYRLSQYTIRKQMRAEDEQSARRPTAYDGDRTDRPDAE